MDRNNVAAYGTLSRVLFPKRELTEFLGKKLGEFCEKLGEFAIASKPLNA